MNITNYQLKTFNMKVNSQQSQTNLNFRNKQKLIPLAKVLPGAAAMTLATGNLVEYSGDKYYEIGMDIAQFKPNMSRLKKHSNESSKYINTEINDKKGKNINCDVIKPDNYVEPLKTHFICLKQARDYGKERAISALKSDKPYEHMVLINKKSNTVEGEYKGDNKEVGTDVLGTLGLPKELSVVHGHPTICNIDGILATTPVSWQDYVSLSTYGEDCIAFDINGKFSMLTKKSNFKPLPQNIMKAYEMLHIAYMYPKEKYLHIVLEELPSDFKDVKSYRELFELLNQHKNAGTLTKKTEIALNDGFKKLQSIVGEEQLRGIDRFWRDYADKLGVIYRTNYQWIKS